MEEPRGGEECSKPVLIPGVGGPVKKKKNNNGGQDLDETMQHPK